MTDTDQAEHAEKFRQVASTLKILADQLVAQNPTFRCRSQSWRDCEEFRRPQVH